MRHELATHRRRRDVWPVLHPRPPTVNALLALGVVPAVSLAGIGVTPLDLAGLGLAAAMVTALVVRAARNLRELARREPVAQAAP